MNFVLLVEGHTEKKVVAEFLKRWLDAKLPRPVSIRTVKFEGWPEFDKKVEKKARMYLEGRDKDQVIAVIGLLDLYGPTFYPLHLTSVKQRYDWAVREMEGRVDRPGFRMFFAVHETEAWLLSAPDIFPPQVHASVRKEHRPPEEVNFNTPPSEWLDKTYEKELGKCYKKTVDGANLFRNLNPEIVREKCPYFRNMLDELLKMAQQKIASI